MCKPISEPTETAKVSSLSIEGSHSDKESSREEEIHIRTYRTEDKKQCQDLFVQGRMSLLPDYYKVVLFRSYESGAFYALMLLALIYLPAWWVGLMVMSWFAIWYGVVTRVFDQYLISQFKKDMNDIEGNYLVEGGTFLVATMGGGVVGMVGGRRHKKLDNFFLVCRMNVDRRAQKRGIAGKLMSRLEEFSRAEGFQAMCLTCTTAQYGAHALYHKHGFKIYTTSANSSGMRGVHICKFRKELV